jgi:ankyrin repeat protein
MSTSTPPPNGSSTTTPPTNPADLPPEALDLAAKLFDLARAGSTAPLSAYLSAGIPPNLTNSTGDTLLMLASYHGHAETTSMLLGAGADANVLNGRGQSPLAGAVFKGHEEVVRVLYEGGADAGLGQPCAVDCARMFKRGECLRLFGVQEEQEA